MKTKEPSVHWSELSSDSGIHYCVNCGRSDETVRFVSYPYVFSLIFVSYRRAFSGIWCARHRLWYGSLACLITLLFGWFGIPWGLIFTPVALYQLALGGLKDDEANARILSALGDEKLSRGERDDAIRCFEQSLRYEDQPDTRERLKALYAHRSPIDENIARIIWQFAIILAIPLFLCLAGILVGLVDNGISIMLGNLIGEDGNIFTFILAWIPLIFFLFIGIIILRKLLEWTSGATKIASIGLVNLLILLNSIVFVYAVAVGVAVGNLIQYMYYGIYFNSSGEILSTIVSLISRGGLYFLSNAIASGELWGVLYMIILPGFAIFSLIVNIPIMANVIKWQNVLREVSSKGTDIEKVTPIGAWVAITVLAFGFLFLYFLFPQQKHVDFLAASEHYFNGMFYLDTEEFDQAATEFEQAIQLRPDDLDSRLGLGYAYFYQEDYEPAAEVFSTALEIYPESFDLLEAAGWSYYHLGNAEIAKEHFEAALKIIPDSAWSHLGLGWIYLDIDPETSIESFQLVLSQYPDSSDAHLGLGIAYYSIQENQRALEELEIAAQDELNEPLAYYWMGDIYLNEEKYQLAIDTFTRAIEILPDYYNAHLGLGVAYYATQDNQRALDELEIAAQDDLNEPLAYYWMGDIYFSEEKYQLALDAFARTIEKLPDHYDAHLGEANVYLEFRNPEKALESLKTAISLQPENHLGYIYACIVYNWLGEQQEGLAHIEQAINYAPDNQMAHAIKSMILRSVGEDDAAEAELELSLGFEAVDFQSAYYIASALSGMQRFGEANKYLEETVHLLPDGPDVDYYLSLAGNFSSLMMFEEAHHAIDRSFELDPENTDNYIARAAVFADQENLGLAQEQLEIALSQEPENEVAHVVLSFINFQTGNFDEAIQEAEQAIHTNKNFGWGYMRLAFAYHAQSRLDEALDAAQEAVRLNPVSDSAHYILGVCYMEKDMTTEAIQEFEQFLHYYYDRAYVRDYKLKAEEYLVVLKSSP